MLLWLLGCATPPPAPDPVTVLAASSLTDVFMELEALFELVHPEQDVVLSFAGSQTLATQVRNGITADAVATAGGNHLSKLAAEGLVDRPRTFATNHLVLALGPTASPSLDWARLPEVQRLVLGAPEVPVGAYTHQLLARSRTEYGSDWATAVEQRVVSREPSVRMVLAKVAMGEADGAVVYATDARSAAGVRTVALPPALSERTTCEHALLSGRNTAATWLAFVESPPAQAVLHTHGFGQPHPSPE